MPSGPSSQWPCIELGNFDCRRTDELPGEGCQVRCSGTPGCKRGYRICSKMKACEAAIKRGFKQGKGLGVDGFDGYLIRIASRRMQRRYWRILQGVIRGRRRKLERESGKAMTATVTRGGGG